MLNCSVFESFFPSSEKEFRNDDPLLLLLLLLLLGLVLSDEESGGFDIFSVVENWAHFVNNGLITK